MIIDINAFLGHYPFRRLPACHADSMIELMNRQGIDRAIVSSLHALCYRDAHRGNQDLYEETKKWDQRFVCVATANPKYAGWQHDLDQRLSNGVGKR